MSEQNQNPDQNLIEGHEYDGIRELDNPLPGWWLITFFGTIIFSFIYWLHYDVTNTGPNQAQELAAELLRVENAQKVRKLGMGQSDGAAVNYNALLANPSAVASGREVYTARCAACHGTKGEGMIGPNLTDNFWIHGSGKVEEIEQMVRQGVAEKGMPAWEQMLKADEIHNVTVYVASIRGSNVAGGKKSEGTEVKGY